MTHILASPTHIEFADINRAYPNGVQVPQDIDPTTRQGEIFNIIGRNGAGKSILLHLSSRLEDADSDEMSIHGESAVCYSTCQLHDLRRRVATIFQHFNLTATKIVAQNTALPLKAAGVPTGERQHRAGEMLELVGPSALCDSYPTCLSGGQKQRTGIAWALATQPGILLCGKATSALDPENILPVLTLFKEINQCLGLTTVLITHEMKVTCTLRDRVGVLEGGCIAKQGDIWRVFNNPQHPMTCAMLGLQHPGRSEAGPPLRDCEQVVTLRFDGNNGRGPNLQHIANLLGGDARLLHSNYERVQGRVIDQLRVRLSGPLAVSVLAQDSWVANSILTHHHQTAEITAS